MDPVLRRVLDAPDAESRERALTTLVEAELLPLARAIVSRKLTSYSGRTDAADRDDVVSEAMITLIARLRALTDGEAPSIENLQNYAATIVHSACAHYIRRRYPQRTRLKARLRYVLSTVSALAIWTVAEGDLVCGSAAWQGQPADPEGVAPLRNSIGRQSQPWGALRPAALGRALMTVFTETGCPVAFDVLVAGIAAAADLREPAMTTDVSGLPADTVDMDVAFDHRRLLAHAWDELRELPLSQRIALLLNLRGSGGHGVLWLFPVAGVATVRQIARALDMPDVELAGIWRDLPLDDEAIARRLGCTRQQVINFRMAGRKRLSNRLRDRLAVFAPVTSRQANLRANSSSLKGSA